jgi:acyl-CoA hydrolase
MDQFNFRRPIPVGDTTVIQSYVYAAGATSIRVRLKAARENPRTGEQELTTESYAVYVAIDEDLNPVAVPDLSVSTDRGRRLREAALEGEQPRDRRTGER